MSDQRKRNTTRRTVRHLESDDAFTAAMKSAACLCLCTNDAANHQRMLKDVEAMAASADFPIDVVELVMWNVQSGVRGQHLAAQMGLTEMPSLVAIRNGAIADMVIGNEAWASTGERFLDLFVQHVCGAVASGAQAQPKAQNPLQKSDDGERLVVDVESLVSKGRSLMGKGEAFYAEKFFTRALGLMHAIAPEVQSGRRDEFARSLVHIHSWRAIARMVQAHADTTAMSKAKVEDVAPLQSAPLVQYVEPLTEGARAVELFLMLEGADFVWSPKDCSDKALQEKLSKDARCVMYRQQLVVTLFLSGDLERCLTELLKVKSLCVNGGGTDVHGAAFPNDNTSSNWWKVATASLKRFLGESHALCKAIAW